MISVSRVFECDVEWIDEPGVPRPATIAIGVATEPFTEREIDFDEHITFYAKDAKEFRNLFQPNNGEDFRILKVRSIEH